MPSPSKEERILELFMNEPTKHWHFSDIVETSGVSVNIAGKWLRKLQQKNIIKRVKPKGRMPYFIGNYEDYEFKSRKKLYALQKLYETRLIQELQRLKNAKTIIIFGSYVRTDWNTDSDIDVFVYGESDEFEFGRFWKGLGFQGRSREIQVHTFHSRTEMENVTSGLLKNVLRGYVVKGDIYEVMEVAAS
ncbi:MAG: nucleotidyltransferase domain-containing protein [Nanoarchaeota archaeon]|nr:nucleotidyltransferase domain-containing protein [Nanoarchaeota archaeon]